jgi:hypothetical protein
MAAAGKGTGQESGKQTTHKPFEGLDALLKGNK